VLGYQRAAVVHSGGMDEVSLHAPTLVAELSDGEIKSYQLEASDFGLAPYHKEALAGGTPEENRDILTRLLQGESAEGLLVTKPKNYDQVPAFQRRYAR
jgi:anthranilate synthase/phosphoribosyltransferase